MQRIVEAEWLDRLPPDDPGAVASRRDLWRINWLMGNDAIVARQLKQAFAGQPPRRLVDLGAGDGRFLLRVARRLAHEWKNVEAVLVDKQNIVAGGTCNELQMLGWRVYFIQSDVFEWLTKSDLQSIDLIVANLFLHHFEVEALARILRSASMRAKVFAACEPRRATRCLLACSGLGLVGCNTVTRQDAATSVRAGFCGRELTGLWPDDAGWQLAERPAGLFSHVFCARRAF